MHIVFNMSLPRDALSVPVARRICRDALRTLGVTQPCVDDIELAVTEACTNVLKHAGSNGHYDVELEIGQGISTITVTDTGSGFSVAAPMSTVMEPQESGRGIHLMTALVDALRFSSRVDKGTTVQLEKGLVLKNDSILQQLSSAN